MLSALFHFLATNPTVVYSLTFAGLSIDVFAAFIESEKMPKGDKIAKRAGASVRGVVFFVLACIVYHSSIEDSQWRETI